MQPQNNKKQHVLILYRINTDKVRNTVLDHLNSFKKHFKETVCYYCNVTNSIPTFIKQLKYDAIILHYTFLAHRFHHKYKKSWNNLIHDVQQLNGLKIAIPQDEYDETDKLRSLIRKGHIDFILTCFTRNKDIKYIYPKKLGYMKVIPVLTGYIDLELKEKLKNKIKPLNERKIDISYRARKLPYHFGEHGQLKFRIATFFLKYLKKSNLITNISNTYSKKNSLYGDDWYNLLLNSKSCLGCESGASLVNFNNNIKKCIHNLISKNPKASFESVKKRCFKKKDNQIKCFTVSPRHFEAILTKTLQILVEGDYNGILKPNIHYVKLKKNFSNIAQVMDILKDEKKCGQIVNRAYMDIAESNKYTYKNFIKKIDTCINKYSLRHERKDPKIKYYIVLLLIFFHNKLKRINIIIKSFLIQINNFLFKSKKPL